MVAPTASTGHRTAAPGNRTWLWFAVPLGLIAVLAWPLQALALVALGTTAMTLVSIYSVVAEHTPMPRRLRRRLDYAVPTWLTLTFLCSIVPTFVWPAQVTPLAFALLVVACGVWMLSEWLLGHHAPRTRRDQIG